MGFRYHSNRCEHANHLLGPRTLLSPVRQTLKDLTFQYFAEEETEVPARGHTLRDDRVGNRTEVATRPLLCPLHMHTVP